MKRATRLLLVLSAIVVAATIVLYLLLGGARAVRGGSWLSLAPLLLAEILTCVFIVVSRRTLSPDSEVPPPFFFAKLTVLLLYDAAVFAVVILLDWVAGIPLRYYAAVHVVLGALLALGYGALSLASGYAAASSKAAKEGRRFVADAALEVQELIDRLVSRARSTDCARFCEALRKVQDQMRFSDPMSHEAARGPENELQDRLRRLKVEAESALIKDPQLTDCAELMETLSGISALIAMRNARLVQEK